MEPSRLISLSVQAIEVLYQNLTCLDWLLVLYLVGFRTVLFNFVSEPDADGLGCFVCGKY